ncbi:MAG: 1-acyl-sn-glycerol-3-phosphate acyltransferase [Bacteroidota bacterium]|nr:1-acyl-sn-glycerol-3-phosphate acyltransferase [Bacteroidota bacterium]
MKKQVVDIQTLESVSPVFRGEIGHWFSKICMQVLALDKINEIYERCCDYQGADFVSKLLNELGIHYRIGNAERLKQLPQGAFITVCNHPYGGIDGIMLIDLMASIRADFKVMVNKILTLVKTMDDNFISVTPFTTQKPGVTANINGIRETITCLKNGHPVGFFPSGAVSNFSLKEFKVIDRPWQQGIIRLIHQIKAPIVPVRFFDKNSPFFYFLGLINWRIRLLRMPCEVLNKKSQNPRIGIGEIISVEEQAKYPNPKDFSAFLRNSVYNMPLPASFTPRNF